jgi:ABC-type multidrug transport system permease subunit
MWYTGGVLWPLEAMPYAFRMISYYLNPLTIPIEALRSVMLRGWGLNNIDVIIGYIVSIGYTLIFSVMNFVLFEKFSISAVSTKLLNKF